MRGDIRLLIGFKLFGEDVAATGSCDETEEGRGRVERSRAELRMGLEGDKVRVIYTRSA
jgi:hypothetical protein